MSADPLATAILALGVTDNTFNSAIGGSGIVKGRFYPEGFKKDEVPVKPYATYRNITMAGEDQFRTNIEKALIQVKVYSDKQDGGSEADQIAQKAFNLFHKTALTVTGYKGVRLFRENRVPSYREDDFYTSVITFRTLIQEN